MVTSVQSLLQISQFLYGKSYNFNSWQSYSCQLANGLFSPAMFSRLLRKLFVVKFVRAKSAGFVTACISGLFSETEMDRCSKCH